MKRILLFCIISLSLFAQSIDSLANPKVYSALGDEIYDNVYKIEKLKQIEKYSSFMLKIDAYLSEVAEAKKLGFAVESGQKRDERLNYLDKIRKLSKENSYFFRSAYSSFKSAIDTEDSKLFLSIVNSEMINAQKNSAKIINYYKKHSDEIDSTGIIQNLIDEANNKKNKKYTKKVKSLTNKAKVKRIREADKYNQEALEKKLSDEVAKKKEKIKQEQERELFK